MSNLDPSADNEVDASGGLQKFKTKVELSYNGDNTWLAPAMFRSMCTIDITYFPFDEQLCSLRFGSWAYDITKLDVFPDYNQTELYQSMFTENQEWEYVSLTIDRTEVRTRITSAGKVGWWCGGGGGGGGGRRVLSRCK